MFIMNVIRHLRPYCIKKDQINFFYKNVENKLKYLNTKNNLQMYFYNICEYAKLNGITQ